MFLSKYLHKSIILLLAALATRVLDMAAQPPQPVEKYVY
jgi:hypothetical protein